jgi:hypothetical protein
MSRENGTTAQGPKTHATASSESMGQWRGARQAVQPLHTLWPRIEQFLTWSENDRLMTWSKSHLDFIFPLIYPATPFRAGARHGRFRRTLFQPRTSFWVGHRQLKLNATKPTLRFAHTFWLLAGKNADLVKNNPFRAWSKISIFQSLANTCQKALLPTPVGPFYPCYIMILYIFFFVVWLFLFLMVYITSMSL